MGTMLYERGIYLNRSFEEVCLADPSLVRGIHREYLEAGSEVITTNSWGAGIPKLRAAGIEDSFEPINRAAAAIARAAIEEAGTGRRVYVAGSIGPLGARIRPLGPLALAAAESFFERQASALASGGVDLIILETFVDVEELLAALRACRRATGLPIIASMTINAEGSSLLGSEPELFTSQIEELAPDAIGLNCSEGPKTMLDAAERMLRVTGLPLCVQPNAGAPANIEGRNIYRTTPSYVAKYAKRMIQAGVRIVGGCCGTTPAHIREIRTEIRALSSSRPPEPVRPSFAAIALAPLALEEKGPWASALARGVFATCLELVPPRGIDLAKTQERASSLKSRGINAINVPDSPRAQAKMSAVAAAAVIQARTGITAIPHITCKDKNLLALQAELLGAHALGIRNLLLVTGDSPSMGSYPDATAVFDIDSIGLCSMVSMLNRGYDLGHNPIGGPTGFCYGVALNPSAINPDRELERFRRKVEAGAEFAITQPIFEAASLFRFLDRLGAKAPIPIIAGIWPLTSLRNAEFMKHEVPGVVVPDSIIDRMTGKETKEAALQEGIAIAREILAAISGSIAGVQISSSPASAFAVLEGICP